MNLHTGGHTSIRVGADLVDHAMRRFQLLNRQPKPPAEHPPARIMTFSRQLGCGGRKIAEHVGQKLGWPVYDKEILDILAQKCGSEYKSEMFEAFDESVQGEMEVMLCALFGRLEQSRYFWWLPKVILTLAKEDCIILGRGAHLLLPDSLKLKVEASMDTRIQNMIRYEKLKALEAKQQILQSDKAREKFTRRLISMLPENNQWLKGAPMYDLVINTDQFDVMEAASIVISAARHKFALDAKSTAKKDVSVEQNTYAKASLTIL